MEETLEEVAERFYQKGLKDDLGLSFHDGVSIGAKWQAGRMYSEEDMKTLFAKTLESSPSTDSHTRMISDTEYRHFVMDEMYNRIIKSLQQTKWQAEKLYSEEDIALAFNEGQAYSVTGKLVDGKEWVKTYKKEWFEQFKKK